MITGTDSISAKVFESFKNKIQLQAVADNFNLSLDQIKRLKRFYNYVKFIQAEIGEQSAEQFAALGLKSLVLSRYINKEGIEVLLDILPFTSADTKRDELLKLMRLYKEKQYRVLEFKQVHEKYLLDTEREVAKLNTYMKELTGKKNKILTQYKFTEKYSSEISDLLLFYLVVLPNGYALRHRLHDGFKAKLRKLNIIKMNSDYLWEVTNLDLFVAELEHRLANGYKYKYTGDESERYRAVYRHAEQEDYIEIKLKETEVKIQEIINRQQANERTWKDAMKKPFQTFEESSIGSDQLSDKELLAHRTMQNDAMKWLYSQGYVVCTEVTLPNNRRADVVGYKGDSIVIIEVKASSSDFRRDVKWRDYLVYCHEFYFYLGYDAIVDAEKCEGNVLYVPRNSKEIMVYKRGNDLAAGEISDAAVEEVKYLITRTLSKKSLLGW